MAAWRPGERIDRFEIVGRLASGGMADVYVAELNLTRGLKRRVALKRVREEYASDPEFAAMFFEEARVAAQLSHPSVLGVVDAFETGGGSGLVLVQEYVPGWDLAEVLREGPLEAALAVGVAQGVAEALESVHSARDVDGEPLNIVHRDVSPSNVLLGADGTVRLLDFGIAKAARTATRTAPLAIKGKLAYMAPEQARGQPLDARADVFALGLCLFEMLHGRRLNEARGDRELLAAARAPQALMFSPPGPVPDALEALVRDCLAFERDDRPSGAAALLPRLEACRAALGGFDRSALRAEVERRRGAPARPVSQGESRTDRWLGRLAGALGGGPTKGR